MNSSSPQQRYAYRRDPAQVMHSSTFHPHQHVGHAHGIHVVPSTSSNAVQQYSAPVAAIQHTPAVLPPAQATPAAASPPQAGFSLASLTKYANVDEIKGLVDRFGGLDGILATVTKVQKVVSTVGQIAPMVKVFSGLGKKSATNEAAAPAAPARRPTQANRVRNGRRNQNVKSRRGQNGQRSPNVQRIQKKSTPLTKRPTIR